METTNSLVYAPKTIDFVTASAHTCLLLEHASEMERAEMVCQLLQLLPGLYMCARALPHADRILEGELQRWVQEDDYHYVAQGVLRVLGTDDTYLSVLTPDARYTDEPCTCSIAENLADIYQELKDMAGNFQLGQEEIMQEAVVACVEAFYEHWGQKLLNALCALHALSVEENEELYEGE